jgi:hypothetical protein
MNVMCADARPKSGIPLGKYWIGAAVILALPMLLFFCGRGIGERRLNATTLRFIRFGEIRSAIHRFSWEHGHRLPEKVSELTPEYIAADQLSNSVYLGATGIAREIIAYEGEGQSNRASNQRSVINVDFSVVLVTLSELDQMLHEINSPRLEGIRRNRVIQYMAHLSGSCDTYRLRFGGYPTGDNASVTRVLRDDDLFLNFEQEINARGEELDPWGTPYWIGSDGEVVRVKSAGPNRRFERTDSPDYDDICFTFARGSGRGEDTKF